MKKELREMSVEDKLSALKELVDKVLNKTTKYRRKAEGFLTHFEFKNIPKKLKHEFVELFNKLIYKLAMLKNKSLNMKIKSFKDRNTELFLTSVN